MAQVEQLGGLVKGCGWGQFEKQALLGKDAFRKQGNCDWGL
jgi:hypothetical protein